MGQRRKVILITDGDRVARQTVEWVAQKVGGRCISASAGNPTPFSGPQLVERILRAAYDPVLVMFDDCGSPYVGKGEQAMIDVATHPTIEVLGAIAVASNSPHAAGVPVDIMLDQDGKIVTHRVDKAGREQAGSPMQIVGDTVQALNYLNIPLIVGIGDVGKMEECDAVRWGAPVTTKAVQLILERANREGTHHTEDK